jgi:hypothetical protein
MIQRIQQSNIAIKPTIIKGAGRIMNDIEEIDTYSGLKIEFHSAVMSKYENLNTVAEKVKTIKEKIILECEKLGRPADKSIKDETNFETLSKKLKIIDDETFDRLVQKGYFSSQLKTYINQLRIINLLG